MSANSKYQSGSKSMKVIIPILLLFLAVTGLCIWEGIHTKQVFTHLEKESGAIYSAIIDDNISNTEIQDKIWNLNDYWTDKMDSLCISISRKDLQPISDYLQHLCSAIINNSQEDAVIYSRLLSYNLTGLAECNGISVLNLL